MSGNPKKSLNTRGLQSTVHVSEFLSFSDMTSSTAQGPDSLKISEYHAPGTLKPQKKWQEFPPQKHLHSVWHGHFHQCATSQRNHAGDACLKAPEKTVYANVTADDIMKDFDGTDAGAYLTDMLAKQAMSPVYWEEIIKRFEADGVKAIVEVGPGHTLTGLTKKTCPEIAALNVENVGTLKETVQKLAEML